MMFSWIFSPLGRWLSLVGAVFATLGVAWLKGRAWDGAPATPLGSEAGHIQLGWEVHLGRLGDGIILARRISPQPVITVNVRLDAD